MVDTIIFLKIKCYHKTGSNPVLNRFGISSNIKLKKCNCQQPVESCFQQIFEGYFWQNIVYFVSTFLAAQNFMSHFLDDSRRGMPNFFANVSLSIICLFKRKIHERKYQLFSAPISSRKSTIIYILLFLTQKDALKTAKL